MSSACSWLSASTITFPVSTMLLTWLVMKLTRNICAIFKPLLTLLLQGRQNCSLSENARYPCLCLPWLVSAAPSFPLAETFLASVSVLLEGPAPIRLLNHH